MFFARDPFARTELRRDTVWTEGGCLWCDQNRKTRSGRGYLWRYTVEQDGSRRRDFIQQRDPLFCCVDCFRSYNS